VRADGGQESGADAGHPVEPIECAERSAGLAIRDDGLAQRQTDTREAGQLAGGGQVGVYPLTRAQGAGKGEDAVPVRHRRLGWERGEKLDLSRRLSGTRDPPPHALAGETEGQQQQERAALDG
jgi:hypothetical protein